MKAGRIVAIVIGGLVGLVALAMLLGGAVLTIAYAVERDDDGFFDQTFERIGSSTPVVITDEADLRTDPPDWFLDFVDFSVRVQATSAEEIFLGIGPADQVDAYIAGVARDEITRLEPGRDVRYRFVPGGEAPPTPPGEQGFWVASAAGSGTVQFTWDFTDGTWVAVLMNADASPGILADVTVGVRSGALLPVGLGLLAAGIVLVTLAVVIILLAVREPTPPVVEEPAPAAAPVPAGAVAVAADPVRLEADLDEPLSRWLWLVKWFLAIPHFIVLVFLWIAFVVLTIIAFFAILFTGRYPQGIFTFNVGVMRWGWRVHYYCLSGGLGTDRYPPFSLDEVADYPAHFDVAYPEQLSRGLVLVKWWLLAIPHYVVVAIIAGGGAYGWGDGYREVGLGLTGVLVLFAGVALLVTGRYPRSIFDLVVGLNRWMYRVIPYAALMTDRYPPFRLDQGGTEPPAGAEPSPGS